MESEDEHLSNHPDFLPSKRHLPKKKTRLIKRPRFIKPTVPTETPASASISLRPEEVFDIAETEVPTKKIELRFGGSLHLEKDDGECAVSVPETETPESGGFGVMHPLTKPVETSTADKTTDSSEVGDDGSVITSEQLTSNRIPQKGLSFDLLISAGVSSVTFV